MIIQMTERHIREGLRTSPCECPVAKAIKDATGFETIVSSAYVILMAGGKRGIEYALPREVKRWIRNYDAWRALINSPMSHSEQITFELKR